MVDDMFTMSRGLWMLGAGSLLAWVGALVGLPPIEIQQIATSDIVTAPAEQDAAASTPEPILAAASAPAPKPTPVVGANGFPVVNAMLELDRPLAHGEYAWGDERVTAGEVWIVVDISTQTLHAFRGDVEIGRAVVLYGADNKPTPLGQFTITQKRRHHVSNLYDVEMPFMMRLTDDGIAIHASDVEQDAATRGCIGLPTDFAELLFAEARVGTRVLVVKGDAFRAGVTA